MGNMNKFYTIFRQKIRTRLPGFLKKIKASFSRLLKEMRESSSGFSKEARAIVNVNMSKFLEILKENESKFIKFSGKFPIKHDRNHVERHGKVDTALVVSTDRWGGCIYVRQLHNHDHDDCLAASTWQSRERLVDTPHITGAISIHESTCPFIHQQQQLVDSTITQALMGGLCVE